MGAASASQQSEQLQSKLRDLDLENDKLKVQISMLKNERVQLTQEKTDVQSELQRIKFDLDYVNHQHFQEQQKSKDLLSEINSLNSHCKKIEADWEAKLKESHVSADGLKTEVETLRMTIGSLEKRIKDKDKKLQSQETQIIDLQEDKVMQMNETEKEMASQKQMYEH